MDHTQKLVALLLLDNHQGTKARTVLFEKTVKVKLTRLTYLMYMCLAMEAVLT